MKFVQGSAKLVFDPREMVDGCYLTMVYGIVVSREPFCQPRTDGTPSSRELHMGNLDMMIKKSFTSEGTRFQSSASPEDILESGLDHKLWTPL